MKLLGVSLREAIDAVIEEETVYMLVRMEQDTSVIDLFGADGYVVMQEEPEPELVPEPKPAKQPKQPKQKKQIWGAKSDPVRIDHGKIVALYTAKWSIKKISDEIGCSQQTVINHLKKASTMSRKLIREEQAERWKKFPPDRICFAHSMEAAKADMQCVKAYMAGQMPMALLCLCIARNNYLPEVTEEQMLNELKIIGWL